MVTTTHLLDPPPSDNNCRTEACRSRPSTSSGTNDTNANQQGFLGGSSVGALGTLKYVEDFEILETLGKGFFGVVYKVREKRSDSQCQRSRTQPSILVMKEPIIHNSHSGFSAKKIVSREYYMLRLLKHPNILKTRGICLKQCQNEWKLNLLVDYCDAGSLQQTILNLQKPFTWLCRCNVALDIARAMAFVHRSGYMHRDLTSMNVLLQSNVRGLRCKAVVADFGLSCKIPAQNEIKQQVGTQNWMSPEMLQERFYDEKSDVFSFGIILCQMIARIDADHDAGLYRTTQFGLDYIRFSCLCGPGTPLSLLKTSFSCCLWNSVSRPSFEQLHEQIRQIINEDLNDVSSIDESRMERAHSDAAIKTPSVSYLSGKRYSQVEQPFRPGSIVIPEGVSIDAPVGTPTMAELGNRMKELATSVANEDPDYQESTLNPFSHDRYRSIRKVKPGDRYFIQRENARRETLKTEINSSSHLSRIDDQPKLRRKRSASVPSLCFSYGFTNARSPLIKASKRSMTLGLGEKDRITMTFRDYDKKFENTSRSGILISQNDLSRVSDESLDEFQSGSDDDSLSSLSVDHYSSDANEEKMRTSDYQTSTTLPSSRIETDISSKHDLMHEMSKSSSTTENLPKLNDTKDGKEEQTNGPSSSVKKFIRRRSSLVYDSQCAVS
ncbi:Protein kinase domain-containing protein [Aphelenchoides besseyi]|nr:Protein kinase domain-containing protein [Aphelenchoides besseyi]KAI6194458.1 Protein kinase domain-containing protein [Aphelenchoides besseyi]